jgi:P27 family predicted phage terminase small subunit
LQRSGELTIKTAKGHPRINPLVRIASQAMADMQRIGAQFGLSPNARLRFCGIEPPPPPSKFDGLLK